MKKILIIILFFTSIFTKAQNVGVGVSNPQNKLHVGGGFRLDTLTGVGGSGLVWHNPNGVVYGIKLTGNTNDVLRGDGTFGAINIDGAIGWLLNGNSGTNPATNFIGTTDDQPLVFKVNNIRHGYISRNIFLGSDAGKNSVAYGNIAIGSGSMARTVDAVGQVAIGDSALSRNLGLNGFGGFANTAIGWRSLYSNVLGNSNVAVGLLSMEKNSFGDNNTAFGTSAMRSNTSGSNNVAMGADASFTNQSGSQNTAVGRRALYYNTSTENSATGYAALENNTTGYNNSAFGSSALLTNRQGYFNSAFGSQSLLRNSVGHDNTAAGYAALHKNEGASFNTAIGAFAMYNNTYGFDNVAIGYKAMEQNTFGIRNTAIGVHAGAALPSNVTNVTCIGYATGWNTTLDNHVNIGNFSVQWIGGQTGWFHYSDKRIKNDIKDDVPGLSFITRLKPITYHVDIDKQEEIANAGRIETNSDLIKPVTKAWEGKYDVEKIKMTGFFAQDVEEAARSINYTFSGVHNPKNGGLLSIDYSAFVVPLVKAVQEQQSTIEKQQKLIDELLKRITALENK